VLRQPGRGRAWSRANRQQVTLTGLDSDEILTEVRDERGCQPSD